MHSQQLKVRESAWNKVKKRLPVRHWKQSPGGSVLSLESRVVLSDLYKDPRPALGVPGNHCTDSSSWRKLCLVDLVQKPRNVLVFLKIPTTTTKMF